MKDKRDSKKSLIKLYVDVQFIFYLNLKQFYFMPINIKEFLFIYGMI